MHRFSVTIYGAEYEVTQAEATYEYDLQGNLQTIQLSNPLDRAIRVAVRRAWLDGVLTQAETNTPHGVFADVYQLGEPEVHIGEFEVTCVSNLTIKSIKLVENNQ